ncbi:MAG: hypothetical protein QW420_01730 [Candidatus Caldarchaeum sp.]
MASSKSSIWILDQGVFAEDVYLKDFAVFQNISPTNPSFQITRLLKC